MTPRWGWFDKTSAALAGVAVAVVIGGGVVGGWHVLFPGDRWYELAGVDVADAYLGEPVILKVARRIHSPGFRGRYVTTVSQEIVPGRWRTVCSGGEEVLYTPDRDLPSPVTLDWWTAGAQPPCQEALGVGRFVLDTCVRIDLLIFPDREVCASSNVFTIRQRSEP